MNTRARLVLRSWLSSASATLLAAGSHALAGGERPQALALAFATAIGAIVGVPLLRRGPRLLGLIGTLLPAQLIYHVAFGGMHGASHAAADASTQGSAAQAGHVGHAGHQLMQAAPLSSEASHAAVAMTLGHLAAAVLSVAVIAWGDRLLAGIAAWCGLRLFAGAVPALPPLPAPLRRPSAPAALPLPHALGLPLASLKRRGPPVLFAR